MVPCFPGFPQAADNVTINPKYKQQELEEVICG